MVFADESVKRQITDSISENLTDLDLESTLIVYGNFPRDGAPASSVKNEFFGYTWFIPLHACRLSW